MSEPSIHHWTASDGVRLGWRELGAGRPVVLVHGLFSDGNTNWVKFGHAAKLAAAGFRVIMPDLRAHGLSDKPQEAAAYPQGILARDISELIAQLGLEDYVLGGFSLGARTVVQLVGEGARPSRAILAGMGLEGLADWNRRQAFFHEAIAQFDLATRGDKWWLAIQFMKTMKVDRVAAGHLLRTFEDAHPDWLGAFTMPTLVLCGTEDEDNGSAPALAEKLPNSRYAPVPGTHMSSVTKSDFGDSILAFCTEA
ncbi:alpha/beta fold hydrolase [Sphingomonas mesophila]|uniref:alpha/beta fold hydrolase n=1 Tax=Sphingomonas mesophila TaxID=2303576 RepID=UPI000E58F46A|nr:alpha/beta fold hydrolase [Sphingomonas mesophila]